MKEKLSDYFDKITDYLKKIKSIGNVLREDGSAKSGDQMGRPEIVYEDSSLTVEELSYNKIDDIKVVLSEDYIVAEIDPELFHLQDLRTSPRWEDHRKYEQLADDLVEKLAKRSKGPREYKGITLIASKPLRAEEVAEIKGALYDRIGRGMQPPRDEKYATLKDIPIRIITEDDAEEAGYRLS